MRTLTVVIALCLAGPALAGDVPTREEAGALLGDGDNAGAADAYKALAKANPEDAQLRYLLGYAHHMNKDYRKAIKAYEKALELGFYPIVTEYNLACAKALTGAPEEAVVHLEASLTAGYADPENMEQDPDLESLRGDERFTELVAWADRNKRPCMHDDRLRGFDFWLGDWQVKDSNGVTVGFNRVEQEHEGCSVQENWQSVLGMTGSSVNYFDPSTEEWVQVWVGSSGGKAVYRGGLDDEGQMVLQGHNLRTDGTTGSVRGTWTVTDAGVTQHFENQDPESGEWSTSFLGYYTPRPAQDETASAD